jgi:hypothetical protein
VVQLRANPWSETRIRISRELPRTVERERTSAIDEPEVRPGRPDAVLRPDEVLGLRAPSGRVHGRVLEQDQRVLGIAGQARLGELVHGGVRFVVVDETDRKDQAGARGHG